MSVFLLCYKRHRSFYYSYAVSAYLLVCLKIASAQHLSRQIYVIISAQQTTASCSCERSDTAGYIQDLYTAGNKRWNTTGRQQAAAAAYSPASVAYSSATAAYSSATAAYISATASRVGGK